MAALPLPNFLPVNSHFPPNSSTPPTTAAPHPPQNPSSSQSGPQSLSVLPSDPPPPKPPRAALKPTTAITIVAVADASPPCSYLGATCFGSYLIDDGICIDTYCYLDSLGSEGCLPCWCKLPKEPISLSYCKCTHRTSVTIPRNEYTTMEACSYL